MTTKSSCSIFLPRMLWTSLAALQPDTICHVVLAMSPQSGQRGSFVIFSLNRFALVESAFIQAFHVKILTARGSCIFGAVLVSKLVYNSFHTSHGLMYTNSY
jgi:hypothetical protein